MRTIGLAVLVLAGCATGYQVSPSADPSSYNAGAAQADVCNSKPCVLEMIECFQNSMMEYDAFPQARLFFLNESYALANTLRSNQITEYDALLKLNHIRRQTVVYIQSESAY